MIYSNIQEVQRMANKKYMVINPDGKMVHFGQKGYADYTAHKDEERRKAFRKRNHK